MQRLVSRVSTLRTGVVSVADFFHCRLQGTRMTKETSALFTLEIKLGMLFGSSCVFVLFFSGKS